MTRQKWAKRKMNPSHIPNHHFLDKTEKTDRELWVECWCAVASANDCKTYTSANNWADKAMEHLNKEKK